MKNHLFQLEQDLQRLKAQAQSGLSPSQIKDTPQTNRLTALQQSLDFASPKTGKQNLNDGAISMSQSLPLDWDTTLNKITLNNYKSWGAACLTLGINLGNPSDSRNLGDPFLHSKLSDSDSVDGALKTYFSTRDRGPIDRSIRLTVKNKETLAIQHKFPWTVWHEKLFIWLVSQLDQQAPPPKYPVPDLVRRTIPAPIIEKIEEMRLFACANALSFQPQIAPALKFQILNRLWQFNFDEQRTNAVSNSYAYGNSTPYRQTTLKVVADRVLEARAAACTTFAMTCGHFLSQGKRNPEQIGYRVEVVAAPNHCFVLINRNDKEDRGAIPPLETAAVESSGNLIIVDAWAGSLGHPIFYAGLDNYPSSFGVFRTIDLWQHYDNNKPDPIPNPFGGIKLRKTGIPTT